jgi:DNA-binding transcriptional ArsR family regulator
MAVHADVEVVAKIFAALGNSTRLTLVKRLATAETFGGQSISELAEDTGLTRQAITKHLEVLADAGIVSRMKPGRATYFELKSEPVSHAMGALAVLVKQRLRAEQELKVLRRRNGLR